MKQFNNSQSLLAQGLSLVELLVAVAILALVAFMVGSVYIAHFKLFSNQNTSIAVESQNRIALDEMVNQIRSASSVSTYPIFTSACPGTFFRSGTGSIVLSLWPLDSNGNPQTPAPPGDDGTFDHIGYCVSSNNNLIKIISTVSGSSRTPSTKILATGLATPQGLWLNYFDSSGASADGNPSNAAQVQIRLIINQLNFDKRQTFTSDQTVKAVLRNKLSPNP